MKSLLATFALCVFTATSSPPANAGAPLCWEVVEFYETLGPHGPIIRERKRKICAPGGRTDCSLLHEEKPAVGHTRIVPKVVCGPNRPTSAVTFVK